jgi:drug/metabolite transporter (DMT)-like permease
VVKENLRGIMLMVASMLAFALEDMFVIWASDRLSTGQILAFIGTVGGLAFAAVAVAQRQRLWTPDFWNRAVIWRNAGEVAGTFGFINALALVPLSTVAAILQAMPLAVTLGAALFLREAVGWRRWTAITVGFIGVLIVIRPGTAGFDPNALWAVLTVAGLSARDVATRRVPKAISTLQLSVWGFLVVALLGIVMEAAGGRAVMPNPGEWGVLTGAVVFSVLGYWAITAAMRLGEVSAITPFRYSRLVFALIIGALVFGERPDAATLLGAALIIASGLYSFARERARARRALASAPAAG